MSRPFKLFEEQDDDVYDPYANLKVKLKKNPIFSNVFNAYNNYFIMQQEIYLVPAATTAKPNPGVLDYLEDTWQTIFSDYFFRKAVWDRVEKEYDTQFLEPPKNAFERYSTMPPCTAQSVRMKIKNKIPYICSTE